MAPQKDNDSPATRSHPWKAILFFLGGLVPVGLLLLLIKSDAATALEESILESFRHSSDLADPIGPVAVEEGIRDLTSLGGTLVTTLTAACGIIVLFLVNRRAQGWFLLTSYLLGTGYIFLIKMGFDRPRPDVVDHSMRSLSPSFPSGHSASSAMILLLISAIISEEAGNRGLTRFVFSFSILLTLCIGVSRIYMGVHWPTDVLGGWIVGVSWAGASWWTWKAIEGRLPAKSDPART